MINRPIFLVLALTAFPGTALAGLIMTTEHRRHEGSDKPSATTVSMEGGNFRADVMGDQPTITIFDGKQMVSADPQKKTYRVMTEEDLKALAAKASEARAKAKENFAANRDKMEAAMAKMSPEQRKRMEAMLGQDGVGDAGQAPKRPDVKYVATGQKKTVVGHGCEVYRQMRGGKLDAEICFIPWSAGVVTKADLGSFQKLEEFMKPLTGNLGEGRESFLKAALDAPGVPALTQHLDANGKPTSEERLTSVKRTSVPASQFAVPAGYTKLPNPF